MKYHDLIKFGESFLEKKNISRSQLTAREEDIKKGRPKAPL